MADPATANYAKQVQRITEHWTKEIAKHQRVIDKAEKELEKLGEKPPFDLKKLAKDADKKKKTAAKCIVDARKAIERATNNLEVNLKLIEPAPEIPERELIKLPPYIEKVIKKGGLPLGKNVTLKPKVKFDFKKRKLKEAGLKLEWKF